MDKSSKNTKLPSISEILNMVEFDESHLSKKTFPNKTETSFSPVILQNQNEPGFTQEPQYYSNETLNKLPFVSDSSFFSPNEKHPQHSHLFKKIAPKVPGAVYVSKETKNMKDKVSEDREKTKWIFEEKFVQNRGRKGKPKQWEMDTQDFKKFK
jgi:hypothetical protein